MVDGDRPASGWTVEHVAALFVRVEAEIGRDRANSASRTAETDRRYDNRFDAAATLTEQGFAALRDSISAADRRYAERYAQQSEASSVAFAAQQTAMTAAMAAAEKAVQTALAAAKEAVDKAEIAASKRFDSVNEFRAQLADQAANLMPKAEALVLIAALSQRIDALTARNDEKFAVLSGTTDERFQNLERRLGALALEARSLISSTTVLDLIAGVDARAAILSDKVVFKTGTDSALDHRAQMNLKERAVTISLVVAVVTVLALIATVAIAVVLH